MRRRIPERNDGKVLVLGILQDLVNGVHVPRRIPQCRRPILAAGAHTQNMARRHESVRPNGERGTDRAVQVDSLLIRYEFQGQRSLVSDFAIRWFELHHLEGRGTNVPLRARVQIHGPRRNAQL